MKKKLTTALSILILLPVLFYLTGILAQFIINIAAWKAAGSDYRTSPGLPSLELDEITAAVFTFPEGLIALSVIVVGIAVLIVFGFRIGWDNSGTTDSERNLTISHSGSHGTAAFMDKREADACLIFDLPVRPAKTSSAWYQRTEYSHFPRRPDSIPISQFVVHQERVNLVP